MILGQSAGTIASMAIDKKKNIYDFTYDEIKTKLESDGQILNTINYMKPIKLMLALLFFTAILCN